MWQYHHVPATIDAATGWSGASSQMLHAELWRTIMKEVEWYFQLEPIHKKSVETTMIQQVWVNPCWLPRNYYSETTMEPGW